MPAGTHLPTPFYDCEVPAYRKGRICLVGRRRGLRPAPHTAAGALKGINDAIALGEALTTHRSLEAGAQPVGTQPRNRHETTILVRFGNQLGRAARPGKFPTGPQMGRSEHGNSGFTSIVGRSKTEVLDPDLQSAGRRAPRDKNSLGKR